MKDAGIDMGYYVLVNHQESVDNGQVIITLLDEEATLKKYMQMGDCVLLIPEKAKCEPINLKPDQMRINGVVIRVIKKSPSDAPGMVVDGHFELISLRSDI